MSSYINDIQIGHLLIIAQWWYFFAFCTLSWFCTSCNHPDRSRLFYIYINIYIYIIYICNINKRSLLFIYGYWCHLNNKTMQRKQEKSESMGQNLANEMSTLVQVMTQSRYARNHRLGYYWSRAMSPCSLTKLQSVVALFVRDGDYIKSLFGV